MYGFIDENKSEINIKSLDESVCLFNRGDPRAQKILMEFAENPASTLYALPILKNSQSVQSKSFALTILLNSVKTRWSLFGENERKDIRNFIIKLLLEFLASDQQSYRNILIPSVNTIIVEASFFIINLLFN